MGVIYYMFVSENSNSHHEEEGKPVEMFVVLCVCVCRGRAGQYVIMTNRPTERSTTLLNERFHPELYRQQ